jgi:hypothetical protein
MSYSPKLDGVDWITALKSGAIANLADAGHLQLICSMSVISSARRMTTIRRAAGRVPQSCSREAQSRETQ